MQLKLHPLTGFREKTAKAKTALPLSCFLVYYEGGLPSLAALREACSQAKPETKIIAVFLEMVPLSQELREDSGGAVLSAQAILAAAIVNAATYGNSIETKSLECYVRGPAMLALAEHYPNTTIFLGIDETELQDNSDPFAAYVTAMASSRVVLVAA